jgi:hypothetical protein
VVVVVVVVVEVGPASWVSISLGGWELAPFFPSGRKTLLLNGCWTEWQSCHLESRLTMCGGCLVTHSKLYYCALSTSPLLCWARNQSGPAHCALSRISLFVFIKIETLGCARTRAHAQQHVVPFPSLRAKLGTEEDWMPLSKLTSRHPPPPEVGPCGLANCSLISSQLAGQPTLPRVGLNTCVQPGSCHGVKGEPTTMCR